MIGLCRPLSLFNAAARGAGLMIDEEEEASLDLSSSDLAPNAGERRTGAEGRGSLEASGTGEDGEGDSIILGGGDSNNLGEALPFTFFNDSFAFR